MNFKLWIESFRSQSGMIPPTPENIQKATVFLREKWRERAAERSFPEPDTLEGACKFASLFAQRLFGGQVRGNYQHQFLVLPGGQIVDLTSAVGVDEKYRTKHDRSFWGNPEHCSSLASCLPRVERWVQEFMGRKM